VRGASPSEATTLNLFELSYLMDQLKVERVMTRQVITVTPDTSLAETARLMLENKISGLPVVSAEGRVVGVVTESDIFRVLVALGPDE
jgi:CBS domain-containing protein